MWFNEFEALNTWRKSKKVLVLSFRSLLGRVWVFKNKEKMKGGGGDHLFISLLEGNVRASVFQIKNATW